MLNDTTDKIVDLPVSTYWQRTPKSPHSGVPNALLQNWTWHPPSSGPWAGGV